MNHYFWEIADTTEFIWKKVTGEERWHCWAIKSGGKGWQTFGVNQYRDGVTTEQLKAARNSLQELTEEEVFAVLL